MQEKKGKNGLFETEMCAVSQKLKSICARAMKKEQFEIVAKPRGKAIKA